MKRRGKIPDLKLDASGFIAGAAKAEALKVKMAELVAELSKCAGFLAASGLRGNIKHPSDTFDRLTALGYKLNLITGEYEK